MRRSEIILIVLLVLACAACTGVCVYAYRINKLLHVERSLFDAKAQWAIEANNAERQLLERQIRSKDSMAAYYQKRYEDANEQKQQISSQFKTLKHEINTTADSGQYAITKRLLSGYAEQRRD
ncbi:hypothetical protein CAP35_13715 [Chitinophagaceae bacterium IBVUCB1]|nr:hypothetical protein CAP35_13715 [Chitinophagaceae bacterium IBVUCB1]